MTKMAEQIKNIEEKLKEMPTRDEMRLAFKEGVEEFSKICDEKYATIERLKPLEKLVYGLVGMVLTAVVGAVLALVILK